MLGLAYTKNGLLQRPTQQWNRVALRHGVRDDSKQNGHREQATQAQRNLLVPRRIVGARREDAENAQRRDEEDRHYDDRDVEDGTTSQLENVVDLGSLLALLQEAHVTNADVLELPLCVALKQMSLVQLFNGAFLSSGEILRRIAVSSSTGVSL